MAPCASNAVTAHYICRAGKNIRNNPKPTRRRWPQFGLRAMLLFVTVAALGSAYAAFRARHLEWVRQRHEVIDRDPSHVWRSGFIRRDEGILRRERAEFPAILRWYGERPQQVITLEFTSRIGYAPAGLGNGEEDELERVGRLFPEAAIRWINAQNRSILSRR